MYIINDTLITYGGSITLILRICKWLRGNNIEVIVMTDSLANNEAVNELTNLGVGIRCVDCQNVAESFKVIKEYLDNDLVVLNFYWDRYLNIEKMKFIKGISFKNVMYNIHVRAFDKGATRSKNVINQIIVKQYKNILMKMSQNGSLLFMDSINLRHTEKYYNIKLKDSVQIVRLPYNVENIVTTDSHIKQLYESNIILTASRAEFPYKGYMVGLIEDFKSIVNQFPQAKLVIVSAGDDFPKIKTQIEQLEEKYKESITLYKWMKYDDLLDLMNKSKVYIGMGTTILDAASKYVPAIPVKFQTYDCIANDLFSKTRELTTTEEETNKAVSLLLEILKTPFSSYYSLCVDSFNALEEYNINYVMQQFNKIELKTNSSILNLSDVVLHTVNNLKNKIIYREKGFSIDNIQREETR